MVKKINTLNAEQTVGVKQKLLQIENNINNVQSLKTAGNLDSQTKSIDNFKDKTLKHIETIRTRWADLVPKETLVELKNLENRIGKIDSKDRSITASGLKKYEKEVQGLTNKIKTLGQEQQKINKGLSLGDQFKIALSRTMTWFSAMTAFYGTLRLLQSGVKYIIDLDNAMNQLRIVMNLSNEDAIKLGRNYNQLAREMSVTTTEVANAAVEFARQGLNQDEMNDRLQNTIKYAKISGMEFQESAEIITATVNSMGVETQRAIDVFSYMGDATATGADEIGRAFQKVGGSASAVNLEFEKVSSWIAIISSKTRESAESIGTSVKAMLARVQNMKEYGFDEEDGTKVNDVAKALATVNIALMDSQGQFRNVGTIF